MLILIQKQVDFCNFICASMIQSVMMNKDYYHMHTT